MDRASSSQKSLTHEEIKNILAKKLGGKIVQTEVLNKELVVWVVPSNLLDVCKFLRESELDIDHPRCLCGVDKKDCLEVVYHLCSTSRNHKVTVKVKLSREGARVPSLYPVYKGADWHERETAEMLNIVFDGHPDPRHLLLVDDFEGYPLRKDFPLRSE